MPNITLSSKGQVTLPSEIRNHLGLHTGDRMIAVELDGAIILRPMPYKSFLDYCAARPQVYKGKPVSIEEIKETIEEGYLDRFDRDRKR